MSLVIRENVPLASRTTMGVGGAARYFCEPTDSHQVEEALAWAEQRGMALHVMGGGSNLLVADRGLNALCLRQRAQRIEPVDKDMVDVDAGTGWDDLVGWCVARNLAGVECLSGIPGDVGAAPIQNIGAYGQELSETLVHVEAIDRQCHERVTLSREDCQLAYRDSLFKRMAVARYILCRVRFRFVVGGAPAIRYGELERGMKDTAMTLANVREKVIALRRAKSMVLDPDDENRHSAGSFFVNPAVSADRVPAIRERAAKLAPGQTMPAYPASEGRVKLSAAWMIERAGLVRGTARGRVGISTRHSLAIVNRGGASATEIVAFALEVQQRVHDAFGVRLHPEPRFVGFDSDEVTSLLRE